MLHYLSAVKSLPYCDTALARTVVTTGCILAAFDAVARVVPAAGPASPLSAVLARWWPSWSGFGRQTVERVTEGVPVFEPAMVARRHDLHGYFAQVPPGVRRGWLGGWVWAGGWVAGPAGQWVGGCHERGPWV
jgi:hypothetical protein